jgi:hypothetical protein
VLGRRVTNVSLHEGESAEGGRARPRDGMGLKCTSVGRRKGGGCHFIDRSAGDAATRPTQGARVRSQGIMRVTLKGRGRQGRECSAAGQHCARLQDIVRAGVPLQSQMCRRCSKSTDIGCECSVAGQHACHFMGGESITRPQDSMCTTAGHRECRFVGRGCQMNGRCRARPI